MRNIAQDIKNGDEEAFELFYKAEFNNLVYFLSNYVHDTDVVLDIAQESLWTLWEKRSGIDAQKNVRTFVFTIAKNKALNFLKSKRIRERALCLDEINADIFALGDYSFTKQVEALSLEQLIERTYKDLPETVKESFILSRKFGYTNEEIARRKGISVKAVEYHMKISLQIFRKRLKEYLPVIVKFILPGF